MAMLVCDVCGGNLQMDAGGKTATCQFCGMQYSVERMREKIQEIRGTVKVEGSVQARQTGTTEDVEQWRTLMHNYMSSCDYKNAYELIGKILQAAPTDEECVKLYPIVRGYCDFVVDNGVLTKYTGDRIEITIPDTVKEIAPHVFEENSNLKKVNLPDSVEKIGEDAFFCSDLEEIAISETSHLSTIGDGAFARTKLATVCVPASVTSIGKQAFGGCDKLKTIEFADPSKIREIGDMAFRYTELDHFPSRFRNLEAAGQKIIFDPSYTSYDNADYDKLMQKEAFGKFWLQNGCCPECGSKKVTKGWFGTYTCGDCNAKWSM